MSTHKHFDKICCCLMILSLLLTTLLMYVGNKGSFQEITNGNEKTRTNYEYKIFDTSMVHQIDIRMNNWEEFLADCKSEEYYICEVSIDNETFKNVAIRGKGNTSLSMVDAYDNDRYSFKIEFDHFDDANTYYGLDKLCLNNIIQDNTYMKDYLTYQMMLDTGIAAPLCSYVYITVNGEDWGLYLAVEGIEESFLQRNYGEEYGDLYKPDSMSMGGGRGNGERFDVDALMGQESGEEVQRAEISESVEMPEGGFPKLGQDSKRSPDMNQQGGQLPPNIRQIPERMPMPEEMEISEGMAMPEHMERPEGVGIPENMQKPEVGGMPGDFGKNEDVLLKYIDDDISSYSNIFNSAKTIVTEADKTRLIECIKKLSNGEDLDNTVDIESVIKYFVVHNFVVNFDSYTGSMIHNYYLYEEDGQMEMIPWDYNLAFGGFDAAGDATTLVNYPVDSPVFNGDISERPMIAWIFENPEYVQLYHTYFKEFIECYFGNGYFEVMMEKTYSMIAPYVEKDPTKFCTYEEFEKGVSALKEFCLLRAESISGQLEGEIGTTSETQEKDTLIQADHIQIEDMGSMGRKGSYRGK